MKKRMLSKEALIVGRRSSGFLLSEMASAALLAGTAVASAAPPSVEQWLRSMHAQSPYSLTPGISAVVITNNDDVKTFGIGVQQFGKKTR